MTENAIIAPHVLREYTLLADGIRGAVVGPRGEICWMCAPRWESDAAFSSLIGGAGRFAITPATPFVWGGMYEPGTLIWRSRWVTQHGIVTCREALAYPGDPHRAVVLRRIEPVEAAVSLDLALDVAAGFGGHEMTDIHDDGQGVWTARSGPLYVRLSGFGALRVAHADDGRATLVGRIDLLQNMGCDVVLEISERPFDSAAPRPDEVWRSTETAWGKAVPAVSGTVADRDALTSVAVLRGLTDPGGGMVAAATMSLPERAEQGRNYDYRYVWIRDQCIAGQAAAAVGDYGLLDDAVRFVTERLLADGPQLMPAYTTAGQAIPDQRELDIHGYPGGYNIVGNHVNAQFQLDTFGEAMLLLTAAARCDRLDDDSWRAASIAADAAAARWQEPEAGIWELHDDSWAESRLICVAGLRQLGTLPAAKSRRANWQSLADRIEQVTAEQCLTSDGWWQRSPGDKSPDAALLMPVIRDCFEIGDPTAEATVRRIEQDLGEDLFIYRFRHGPGPLADAEGAFVLCGFAMALAQARLGDRVRAMRYFERNRAACGPPGLFSEEFDVEQRQLRGNLPQAFVHAMFLQSASQLAT